MQGASERRRSALALLRRSRTVVVTLVASVAGIALPDAEAAYDYGVPSYGYDIAVARTDGAAEFLDPLVRQFGSREAVVQQMLRGVGGRTPASGAFEIPVSIGGRTVVVRGAVVDGVVKLGTAFTP